MLYKSPVIHTTYTHTETDLSRLFPFLSLIWVYSSRSHRKTETFPGLLIHWGPCWWWRQKRRGHLIPGGPRQHATRSGPPRKPYISSLQVLVTSVSTIATTAKRRDAKGMCLLAVWKQKQIALWLAADDMFAKTRQTGTLRATTGCEFTSKNQTIEIMLRLTRVEVFH